MAEQLEGRVLTKRNTDESSRDQTQSWTTTMSRLVCVREHARKDKKLTFTSLTHHLNPVLLRQSFYQLRRQSAKGVDGVSWFKYEEDLEERLVKLHRKIQSGSYQTCKACLHTKRWW